MRTEDLKQLISERYAAPEWALLFEVPSGISVPCRRADAISVNLFPSRGLEINGFEIKSSRADLESELSNPLKAEESVWRYCDKWWLVAPREIVTEENIPKSWGILSPTPSERHLEILKQPVENKSPELNRLFLAILLNCSQRQSDKRHEQDYELGYAKGKRDGNKESELSSDRIKALESAIATLGEETGIEVGTSKEILCEVKKFVVAMRLNEDLNVAATINRLKDKRESLSTAISELEKLRSKRRDFFTSHNVNKDYGINLDASNP